MIWKKYQLKENGKQNYMKKEHLKEVLFEKSAV